MERQTNDSQIVKLLSDPFTAAIDVQSKMVDKYLTTIKRIAFGDHGDQKDGKAEVLKITVNRFIKGKEDDEENDDDEEDGGTEKAEKIERTEQEVEIPLISLVKIPALTMKEVEVDLVLSIDEGLKSVKLVSDKSQSTDFSPRYKIKMIADRDTEAEGMKVFTQIMSESMKIPEE